MKPYLHGRVNKPAVAVVGTWDPLLPDYRHLFHQISKYAQARDYCSLVIMIDPNPLIFVHGRSQWPVYDGSSVRIQLIKRSRIDAVLQLRFFRQDLLAGAEDFFKSVLSSVRIEELWLGATQTLGRGSKGKFVTLSKLGSQNNIRVERLGRSNRGASRNRVCQYLAEGNIAAAKEIVGRPPVWARPRAGRLRLAWHPGVYRAKPVKDPGSESATSPMDIEMIPAKRGHCTFAWPAEAKYLRFISGPYDAPGEALDNPISALGEPVEHEAMEIRLQALADPQLRKALKSEPRKTIAGVGLSPDAVEAFLKNTIVDGHSLAN